MDPSRFRPARYASRPFARVSGGADEGKNRLPGPTFGIHGPEVEFIDAKLLRRRHRSQRFFWLGVLEFWVVVQFEKSHLIRQV